MCGYAPARLLGLRGSNPAGGMDVCLSLVGVRVLSGRGLCVWLITRPEKSYRLWCLQCDCEALIMRPWADAPWKKRSSQFHFYIGYRVLCRVRDLFLYTLPQSAKSTVLYTNTAKISASSGAFLCACMKHTCLRWKSFELLFFFGGGETTINCD